MGALEFEPADDAPYDSDTRLEIDTLVDVAREAIREKSDFGTNSKYPETTTAALRKGHGGVVFWCRKRD